MTDAGSRDEEGTPREEPDPDGEQRARADRVAFEAFALAVRVMYRVYEIEEPGTEFEKPWSLLRDIALGRSTLASPGEMAVRFPALRDLVYDSANRVVRHDREMAERILRGLNEAL